MVCSAVSSYGRIRRARSSAIQSGGVAERLKAPVLKTGRDESPSWVRIPPPPHPSPRCREVSRGVSEIAACAPLREFRVHRRFGHLWDSVPFTQILSVSNFGGGLWCFRSSVSRPKELFSRRADKQSATTKSFAASASQKTRSRHCYGRKGSSREWESKHPMLRLPGLRKLPA